MKKTINIIQYAFLGVVFFTILKPYFDKTLPWIVWINEFGYMKFMLLLSIPLFIAHIVLSYFYDKPTFEKRYTGMRVVYGLIALCITALAISELLY